eukprot:CAMPEP_0196581698 /NCGR_PEP_ID=MMETSP1081-20130531/35121_1 /TAXON_ID=36882 /ORGANISM="Pyramimonas amylifera, Strain CCMP720" /LENGTH=64 /DNA_ID=CAMNT_0041902021 /DNA_START=64 /DNA_END=255 /DNA_ORIENTATION=+
MDRRMEISPHTASIMRDFTRSRLKNRKQSTTNMSMKHTATKKMSLDTTFSTSSSKEAEYNTVTF